MSSLHVRLVVAIAVALALANLGLSSCHAVKGKLSCLDCKKGHDLSGIKVLVKCDKVNKLSMATTSHDGFFQTELPKDNIPRSSHNPISCFAQVLGGPTQIYASKKKMASKIVRAHAHHKTDTNNLFYTTSAPLAISMACPSAACGNLGSSKTIDLPVPPEWGLAPTSYYTPFIPIIGIP